MSSSPSARRSRPLLALQMAIALAGSMLAAAAATAPSSAAGTDATSQPLRIGSYNIEINQPADQFRQAVEFIKSQSDVAGLQEAGGGHRREYLDSDRSWRIYHPPSLPQDPVIWNPHVYELVSARQVKISKAAVVEDMHRGGLTRWKAEYVPVVRLRQISTGYVFSVINVHLISGAVNEGHKRPGSPRRFRLYVRMVKNLKSTVRAEHSHGMPVYVMGDFNVGYAADRQNRARKLPYHKMRSVNLMANWQGKTLDDYGTHIDTACPRGKAHCGAYIDQIWAPTKAATAQVFIHEVHSDHYPIMSTYPISVPAGYTPPSGTAGFATPGVSEREWNKPWQTRDNPMVFPITGDMDHGSVDVKVTDGTAVEGKDFTVDTTSLYDNDPSNNRVVVNSVPNFTREPDKTFTLTLVDAVDMSITSPTASGVITNDD
jgi:endonuclease/exonuclease/phosphatase family metal-dependent hydrolase